MIEQKEVFKKNKVAENSYSRHFNYVINKEKIKHIKEWDFYQISNNKYVIQFCIGHLSYVSNISATIFSFDGKVHNSVSKFKLFPKMRLETNPEENHSLSVVQKEFKMIFDVKENTRRITVCSPHLNADITLQSIPNGEKMVILIPFKDKEKFYLNYKENCYTVNGKVVVDGKIYNFKEESFGLLDSGRGVWPYKSKWYWGNGSCKVNNDLIGVNIGYGFGDTSKATENAVFINGKMIKLSTVNTTYDPIHKLEPCTFTDVDNIIDFVFTPVYDNYTLNDFTIVKMECHQVFGTLSGTIKVENKIFEIKEMNFFFEKCKNRW